MIVEGGSQLLQTFIDEGFFDEIRIFLSSKQLFEGIAAPILPKQINLIEKKSLFEDELMIYKNLASR